MPPKNLLGLPPKRPVLAPARPVAMPPLSYVRPGAGAEEDAAKAAAEEAAATGAPGDGVAGTDPPAVADAKEAYIFLQERFGPPAFEGLTDEQVIAEADWHRREEAGFPTDRPTPALYAEHYRLHHPDVAVPPMPPPNTRSGQLDYSSVIALGLIPLGQVAPPGEERFYEPALVTEGMPVTARNGAVYRVVYREGRFMVQSDGPSPTGSPTPGFTASPQPSGSPQATQAPGHQPVVRTDADVVKARRDGRIQGSVWGVLGGIALGVGVTALVVKLWPKNEPGADADRRLPAERSNPAAPHVPRVVVADEGNDELLLIKGTGERGEDLFRAVVRALRARQRNHPTLGVVYPTKGRSIEQLRQVVAEQARAMALPDWVVRVE